MADDDNPLDKEKSNVVSLSVVSEEKEDSETAATVKQLYGLIEEIRKGKTTTLLTFAIDEEGSYTSIIMCRNRFEALGLNEVVYKKVKKTLEIDFDLDTY